jgi:F420-0:gamma-glutamyl ligase
MNPLLDARVETDLFGFQLQHTVISSADEIAAAASISGRAARDDP